MIGSIYSNMFKNVRLPNEMVEFYVGAIANNTMILKVVKEIASRDLCLAVQDKELKDCIFGSTKEDIRKAFPTGKKTLNKKTKEYEDTYISIKVIDKYISFLCGAAMICYLENGGKEKRYVYTERGIQVLRGLAKQGIISMVEIQKNNKLRKK